MPARPAIDRGIIFSAPMVRAILAGQKTQTRRLASSPLAKVIPGDRLWVRESYRLGRQWDDFKAREADQSTRVWHEVDRDNCDAHGKLRPSIFMPRWASRITLMITDVRFEPVDQISEADALAEGIAEERMIIDTHAAGGVHTEVWGERYFSPHDPHDTEGYEHAADAFAALWDSLHIEPGERFADGPAIVALTFAATLANIDSPEP